VAYCLSCLPIVEPPTSLAPKILEHLKSLKADGLARFSSPLGLLHVAFRESGITYIALETRETDEGMRARIEHRLRRSLRDAELPARLRETLETYFRTWSADLRDVDVSGLTPFEQAALRQAALIPPGEVRSYGWIAAAIGRPHAARAVGQAMARNPVPLLYPCHRVTAAGGDLHHYGYGVEMKRRILLMEGCRSYERQA
jgi:methylated-DNA-[protein]-cysteine S-methyltransferase